MKVIALVDGSTYLVQVGHSELEKVFDKYYNKLEKLKVGDQIDLGEGYNFRSDIKKACDDMRDAMKSFDSKRVTMLRFAEMVSELPEEGAMQAKGGE